MDQLNALSNYISHSYQASEYPSLSYQISRWTQSRPLAGLSVLDATPVFRNTTVKYVALLAAGADLTIGLSQQIPRNDEVVSFLKSIHLPISNPEQNDEFDIVMDCAAVFCDTASKLGYVELTRSGVDKYSTSARPVFAADSGRIKRIETSLGTGESFFRAMKQLGYADWQGRKLVVVGSGKVGCGLIGYGLKYGASVTVVTDPRTALDKPCQIIDYQNVIMVDNAFQSADVIVTATGVLNALQPHAAVLNACSALLANMGVEDEFGADIPDTRVLNDKKPLNFILQEPTLLRYIDATMALHNAGALFLAHHVGLPAGLMMPPADFEELLLDITKKNGLITNELKMI